VIRVDRRVNLPRAVQLDFGAGSSTSRAMRRLPTAEITHPYAHDRSFRSGRRACQRIFTSAKLPDHARAAPGARGCWTIPLRRGLGSKLACLLVRLPLAGAYDTSLRGLPRAGGRFGGIALEPRRQLFTPRPGATKPQIARVLADPVRHEAGRWPGGWSQHVYLRLHGSPRMYYSAYDAPLLQALAARLRQAVEEGAECWCIFDNTAAGAAAGNALALQRQLEERR
jgi:hypothetical protein